MVSDHRSFTSAWDSSRVINWDRAFFVVVS